MTEQNHLGPTGTGTVAADVGVDRGALILYAPASMLGAEIEVSLCRGGPRTHVAVRERRLAQGRLFAAFYPSLEAGEYIVWSSTATAAGTIRIPAGEVTETSVAIDPDTHGQHGFTLALEPKYA